MTKKDYQNYLKSDHWKEIKTRYKNSKFPQVCYVCRTSDGLELHHKTYSRLYKEKLGDFIYLCRNCHESVHQYLKKYKSGRTNLWNAARKLKSKLRMRRRKFRNLPLSVHKNAAQMKIKKFLKKVTNRQT